MDRDVYSECEQTVLDGFWIDAGGMSFMLKNISSNLEYFNTKKYFIEKF